MIPANHGALNYCVRTSIVTAIATTRQSRDWENPWASKQDSFANEPFLNFRSNDMKSVSRERSETTHDEVRLVMTVTLDQHKQ